MLLLLLWCVLFVVGVVCQLPDPTIVIQTVKAEREMNYLKWAHQMGVVSPLVDMSNFSNPVFGNYLLRGLSAVSDISVDDEILAVPFDTIFSARSAAMEPDLVAAIRSVKFDVSAELELTALLMNHIQRSDSPWAPMFRTFPQHFFTADQFNQGEMRQVEGPLNGLALERQKLHEQEYRYLFPKLSNIHPEMFPSSISSYSQFKFARLLIQTRAFSVQIEKFDVLGVVPMGEMMNHKSDTKIDWRFDPFQKVFFMVAKEPFKAGTQVYNNYGNRGNRNLLLDFGFVEPNNPYSFFPFPSPRIPPTDKLRLNVLEDTHRPYKLSYPVRFGEANLNLMFTVRIALTTDAELLAVRRYVERIQATKVKQEGVLASKYFNTSLTPHNEALSLNWLSSKALEEIDRYRDTFDEDLMLLNNDNGLARNDYHAIFVRYEEKRILQAVALFAQANFPLVQMIDDYTSLGPVTMAHLALSEADYIENVIQPLSTSMIEKILNPTDEDVPQE